jgi:hypothetical protein
MDKLAFTYQTEMASRLLLTIAAVLLLPGVPPSIIAANGITISFILTLSFQKTSQLISKSKRSWFLKKTLLIKRILTFYADRFYELTQIIINNSDIILVKHFLIMSRRVIMLLWH